MRNLTSNIAKNKEYIDSGVWKCGKSPSGAHHWIISQDYMICKYCNDNRQVLVQPNLKNPTFIATDKAHLYLKAGFIDKQMRQLRICQYYFSFNSSNCFMHGQEFLGRVDSVGLKWHRLNHLKDFVLINDWRQ
jgi:hypothetical protein